MKSPKTLIIGGGIAGLCTGVYLQKHGFPTEILEMSSMAGGLATAWKRRGYTFENCLHWLVGSKEGEELNATWKEVFDIGQLDFYNSEIYQVIEKDGQSLTVYRDVDRMEREFLARAPEDAIPIREFAALVRKLSGFRFPGGESPLPRIVSLCKALPYFVLIGKYRKYDGPICRAIQQSSLEQFLRIRAERSVLHGHRVFPGLDDERQRRVPDRGFACDDKRHRRMLPEARRQRPLWIESGKNHRPGR